MHGTGRLIWRRAVHISEGDFMEPRNCRRKLRGRSYSKPNTITGCGGRTTRTQPSLNYMKRFESGNNRLIALSSLWSSGSLLGRSSISFSTSSQTALQFLCRYSPHFERGCLFTRQKLHGLGNTGTGRFKCSNSLLGSCVGYTFKEPRTGTRKAAWLPAICFSLGSNRSSRK